MSVVHTIGINYRAAPLPLRELLAVPAAAVGDALRQLKARRAVYEAALLSTCNRTEVYCLSPAPQKVADWLDAAAGGGAAKYIYTYRARPAVEHLFRVAGGLDSQILGEPEITGQVKQFAMLARDAGASGAVINRLMEHALAAAAEVRAVTNVGKHSLSYPGLAARAAEGIFSNLKDVSVLFVGGGDITRAGLPIFFGRGAGRLAVASRSLDKAQNLAAKYNGEGFSISAVPERLAEFDIILSSTAAQVPIIGKGAVERALRLRRRRPMMFADLAVPRDLEIEIQTLPDVFVYNLDQFGAMIKDNQQKREAAAVAAQSVIARRAAEFEAWLQQRAAAPRIRQLRADADAVCEKETARGIALLQSGKNAEEVLRQTAARLTAKLMHPATVQIREEYREELRENNSPEEKN